jgi:hypothetical protein
VEGRIICMSRKIPGRQYPTHTPLGQLMRHYGLRVKDVESRAGISYRTLSDYLANRKPILPHHRSVLSQLFQVPPEFFTVESSEPPTGTSGGSQASTVTVPR